MKRTLYLLGLSIGLAFSPAHAITELYIFSSGQLIPDGDPSGVADLQNIVSGINSITDVNVAIRIPGFWNGDLYATLQHDSGFSVLLNRVGRDSNTGLGAFGYDDDGLAITFDDSGGFDDVHLYQSFVGPASPLLGTWETDGRNVDPNLVLDTDARTAQLDSFNGLDANGGWTLFMADLSNGNIHLLESWALQITGDFVPPAPVPSGGSTVLMLGLALAGLAGFRKVRQSGAALGKA